ncbi:hypothetical protein ACFC14_02180 [Microbacterium sp. NPDC055988]|uniref:hypothetical protein n=1 Tax=Microbacterium sp. NPDC055988 TaxID=3345671 RepID=UPI0035E35295
MSGGNDDISTDRNDISTEPGPGTEGNDNLGTEDAKGNPPTVVPSDGGDTDEGDVLAEDPEDG